MTVNEQIGWLNQLIEAALSGNFDLKPDMMEFDVEFSPLFNNIKALIESQKNFVIETQVASSQIISASEDLSLTLEENNELMQELYTRAKEINSLNDTSYKSTVDAIGSIKEITADIEKVRDFSKNAKTVDAAAEEAVNDGISRIYSIIELIGAIENGSRKTVDYVDKFAGSTREISKILKVVHDISRETEILSFNASIESKRAGAAGRGFGVIAGSIRDLAEKSKKEVMEIGDVIEEINAGLRTLTDNIHSDFKNVEQSVSHTKTLEESLSRIRDTFSQVNEQISGIMDATESQSLLAANMNEKITGVEETSELVNTGFNNVYASIKKQRKSMDGLNTLGKYLFSSANEMSTIVKSGIGETFDSAQVEKISSDVFELLKNEVLSNGDFAQLDPDVHKYILDKLLAREIIEAVWSNDAKGRFVYSNPPAGIKNARVREWFKESAAGRKYTSEVYTSAITRKPCVTVSLPIMKNGECLGVLGADLRLK